MRCVLNVSASCLSVVFAPQPLWSRSTKGHGKSFLFSQRNMLFWRVVETSCGCAEPQDIWMHCSCVIMASFSKHYDSTQLQPVCLLHCRKMKSSAWTETAGHTGKVLSNDSRHASLTSAFKFPVVAVLCVYPCIYLKNSLTWDGLNLQLCNRVGWYWLLNCGLNG